MVSEDAPLRADQHHPHTENRRARHRHHRGRDEPPHLDPGDIERSFWKSGNGDLSRLLQQSIRWVSRIRWAQVGHELGYIILMPRLLLALLALTASAQTWDIVKRFPIGGPGNWDYLTPDPATHRLYVPRTSHTLVIDTETGATIADIAGQKNAHGVAIAPAVNHGFISDGGGNGAIIIFDLKTNAVLGSLTTVEDTDGIIFDSASGYVLAVSGRGKALMLLKPDIDPKHPKLEATIPLRGEPEFLAADPSGKAYINLMNTNEVAVVDLKTRTVATHWPVAPGGAPVGMAIDTEKARLFIGCRNPQKLIIMSTKDGKVISEVGIGQTVDAVKLDRGQVFASTAGGLYVMAETEPAKYTVSQIVKTSFGSRTMALDPSTHKIYLPAADYDPTDNGRFTVKPGTFALLVVAVP